MSKDIRHFVLETKDCGEFDVVEYKEYQKLENIIKEVREYIEEMQIWLVDFEDFGITTKGLLEILDKVEE